MGIPLVNILTVFEIVFFLILTSKSLSSGWIWVLETVKSNLELSLGKLRFNKIFFVLGSVLSAFTFVLSDFHVAKTVPGALNGFSQSFKI